MSRIITCYAGVLKVTGETARYKRKRLYARREVCSGTPDVDALRQIESYGLNFVPEDLKRDTVLQQVTADVHSQGGRRGLLTQAIGSDEES